MPRPNGPDLTGATRYRTSLFGKLVLQVEERRISYWEGKLTPGVDRNPIYQSIWRDAALTDFSMLRYIERKIQSMKETDSV